MAGVQDWEPVFLPCLAWPWAFWPVCWWARSCLKCSGGWALKGNTRYFPWLPACFPFLLDIASTIGLWIVDRWHGLIGDTTLAYLILESWCTTPTALSSRANRCVGAHRTAEVESTKIMIEQVEEHFDIKPDRLIGDTAYGTAPMLAWMVDEKNIEPHVPVWDKTERKNDSLSSSDFQWNEET